MFRAIDLIDKIQGHAKVGWFLQDFKNPEFSKSSEAFRRMHDLEQSFILDHNSFLCNIMDQYLPLLEEYLEKIKNNEIDRWSELNYRVMTRTGDLIHVLAHAETKKNSNNEVEQLLIITSDVTNIVRRDTNIHDIERVAKMGWFEIDILDWSRSYFSEEYLKLYQLDNLGHLPTKQDIDKVIHPDDLLIIHDVRSNKGKYPNGHVFNYRLLFSDEVIYMQSFANYTYDGDQNLLKISGAVQNVTEIVGVKEKLREAQRISNTGWFEFNIMNPKLSRYSDEWLEMFGFMEGEKISEESIVARFHPKIRSKVPSLIRYLANQSVNIEKEEVRLLVGTEEKYIRVSARVDYIKGGPNKIFGVATDITDIRMAQKKLYKSELRYRLLSETGRDVIMLLDGDISNPRVNYVSESIHKMTGYSKEQVESRELLKLIYPEDKFLWSKVSRKLFDHAGASTEVVLRMLTLSGEMIWVEVILSLFKDLENIRVRLSIRDVTERIIMRNKLLSANNDLLALIKSTDNIVFVVDEQLQIQNVILKDESRLPMHSRNYLNKSIDVIWQHEDLAHIEGLIRQSFVDGKSYKHESALRIKKDGQLYVISTHQYASYDGAQRVSVVLEMLKED